MERGRRTAETNLGEASPTLGSRGYGKPSQNEGVAGGGTRSSPRLRPESPRHSACRTPRRHRLIGAGEASRTPRPASRVGCPPPAGPPASVPRRRSRHAAGPDCTSPTRPRALPQTRVRPVPGASGPMKNSPGTVSPPAPSASESITVTPDQIEAKQIRPEFLGGPSRPSGNAAGGATEPLCPDSDATGLAAAPRRSDEPRMRSPSPASEAIRPGDEGVAR